MTEAALDRTHFDGDIRRGLDPDGCLTGEAVGKGMDHDIGEFVADGIGDAVDKFDVRAGIGTGFLQLCLAFVTHTADTARVGVVLRNGNKARTGMVMQPCADVFEYGFIDLLVGQARFYIEMTVGHHLGQRHQRVTSAACPVGRTAPLPLDWLEFSAVCFALGAENVVLVICPECVAHGEDGNFADIGIADLDCTVAYVIETHQQVDEG